MVSGSFSWSRGVVLSPRLLFSPYPARPPLPSPYPFAPRDIVRSRANGLRGQITSILPNGQVVLVWLLPEPRRTKCPVQVTIAAEALALERGSQRIGTSRDASDPESRTAGSWD